MNEMNTSEYQFVLAILCALAGYLAYWFTPSMKYLDSNSHSNAAQVFAKRITGLVFLGVGPGGCLALLTTVPLTRLGVNFHIDSNSVLWIICFGLPVVILNYFASSNPVLLAANPQTRDRDWTIKVFLMEYGGWALYLLGYEFLFRGVLFLSILPFLGLVPAIALNVLVYSFAHLPKGAIETTGSIVFGVILCVMTAQTKSIWSAWVLHLILAWSCSFFAFLAQQDMKIKKT